MRRILGRVASAVVAAVLASCGGGGSGAGSANGAGGGTISGVVTYDRVPTSATNGLDYAATQPRPVRGAVVRLVGAGNATLASTSTDDSGAYTLSVPAAVPAAVTVTVLAQTPSPPMVVRDNTDGGAIWAIASQPFAPGGSQTKNLHAARGSGATRPAAPFAILDSTLTAARAFLSTRPVSFAPLTLNWSPLNRKSVAFSPSAGQIVTSHWSGVELYILGEADVDTDEYDDHVIVHEWAHYLESTLSRSDSPGGPHFRGEMKDPRLAFSEGWGNALGAIVLPGTSYRDTAGLGQSQTDILDDFEENDPGLNPGWWSESSIARLLVDLADPANEPSDGVSLGLGPIHDALVGPQKNTLALTTVFSFVSGLKALIPGSAAAIDALVAAHQMTPIQGEFAPGAVRPPPREVAPPPPIPLYEPLPAGQVSLAFADGDFNDLSHNRYFVVDRTGGSLTVQVTSVTQDLDLIAYRSGEVVCAARNPGPSDPLAGARATEVITFPTPPGRYVVVVTAFDPGTYDGTLQVTPRADEVAPCPEFR